MITITITVETEEEATTILEVLEDAETKGTIDFPFNTQRERD